MREPTRAPVSQAERRCPVSAPVFLPDPPDAEAYWAVTTLARLLCVTPAAVDVQLSRGSGLPDDADSPDLVRDRPEDVYLTAVGDEMHDAYLNDAAAERIAAELSTGLLARAVAADPESASRVSWADVHALARHIVETADGETT